MAELTLSENLIAKIRELAQKEQRSPDEVIADMLQQYHPQEESLPRTEPEPVPMPEPLVGLIGLLDNDIQETDLSSTIRDTLKQNTHPKYGWTKRGRTD